VRATIVVAHGAGASVVARHGLYGIAQLSAGRRRCPGASCCAACWHARYARVPRWLQMAWLHGNRWAGGCWH
jgi:hypothetical protein